MDVLSSARLAYARQTVPSTASLVWSLYFSKKEKKDNRRGLNLTTLQNIPLRFALDHSQAHLSNFQLSFPTYFYDVLTNKSLSIFMRLSILFLCKTIISTIDTFYIFRYTQKKKGEKEKLLWFFLFFSETHKK